jgi:hypothetical protein
VAEVGIPRESPHRCEIESTQQLLDRTPSCGNITKVVLGPAVASNVVVVIDRCEPNTFFGGLGKAKDYRPRPTILEQRKRSRTLLSCAGDMLKDERLKPRIATRIHSFWPARNPLPNFIAKSIRVPDYPSNLRNRCTLSSTHRFSCIVSEESLNKAKP